MVARRDVVAASNGVVYRSIALSARHAPSLETMNAIAAFMRDAPKPILVHCLGGADRSGWRPLFTNWRSSAPIQR